MLCIDHACVCAANVHCVSVHSFHVILNISEKHRYMQGSMRANSVAVDVN